VVSTLAGPTGLDATPGVHYVEAVQPPDFATAVAAPPRTLADGRAVPAAAPAP
jgi:hypothetical protein